MILKNEMMIEIYEEITEIKDKLFWSRMMPNFIFRIQSNITIIE